MARGVRAPSVGHQQIGHETLFLEELAHQFHGCSLVARSLHEEIENFSRSVYRDGRSD
jgi:hypothetical protein